MSEALVDYLKALNSAETSWSLYVNPKNIDEFWVGQNCFENGESIDECVRVGTLKSLSFGFQSAHDAIEAYLEDNSDKIEFNGRKVRVNRKAVMTAYNDDFLDDEFREFLRSESESIQEIWAENEAEDFVFNKLPEILQNQKESETEYDLYA